jgi:predicted HTH transcriptional regulator
VRYAKKVLVVIVIYKSDLKPHQMIQNGAFYIRRGSTTDVARREELAKMFQENGLFSYEKVLLHKVPLEALNMKLAQ